MPIFLLLPATDWHLLTIMITPKSIDFTGIVNTFCKCKHDIQENLVVITGIEIHEWRLAEKRK